ncbi:Uncharacterized protein SCF082_LOCUS2551 [Durusdinium trenchii]|uniref:Uncharacterized protein n=1 Tax=Durusdinium trenchii TaxID=1381693 RepID=A0ABP0HN12_9DINO
MSRFDQARALMLRLAHRQGDNTGNSSYYDKDETYGIEEEYERSWHQAPSVLYGDMEYWDHSTAREDYASSSNWYDYDGNWSYHTYEDEEYDYQFDYPEHELYYDDDSAWYEESWNAEENQPPEDGGEKEETFYQGGKGGRTFNLGCSVCGSKWHSASTCPMSKGSSKGQGGYNQGSFKGKNHGRFGKGKGKGKSKGKGKFKGKFHRPYGGKSFRDKGYGRKGYWTSGDSPTTFFRQEQQLRHAREGLQLNLMTQSNDGPQLNEDQAAATPHSHHAVPEQAKATSTGTTENGHDFLRLSRPGKSTQSETSEEPTSASSRKHLNFPVQVNQNCETDAVSSYHMIKGIKRRGLLVDPGAAAGLIGSETLRDLVEECLKPHGLQEQIQWTERRTSVTGISGKGDETLAEVSFQFSLEGDKTGTFTGDVLGGEGSLCPALVSNPSLRSLRAVICSDWFTNGDGLLICPSADDQQTKENTMIRLLLTDSGHYIIPMDKNPPVHEDEQKKAKMFMHTVLNISSQQWSDVHQTNKYCFQVSQMNEMEDNTEDHERNEEDQRPKEHDTTTSPSSSTRSPMSRTYASTRDFWKRVGDQWHRHHVRPRTAIFSPDKGKSPDLLERTQGRRETKICYVNGDEDNIVDTWQIPDAQRHLHETWTGVTIFDIIPEKETAPEKEKEIYIGDREDHIFADEELAHYEADLFPEHITEEKRKYLERFYKAVPEEFYSKLKRKPITPKNCLCVMFPVDFRYGWDIGYGPHQRLLRQVHETSLQPEVLMLSPNCRPWSVSSNQRPPEQLQQMREEEEPGLCFIEERCHKQIKMESLRQN